MLFSDWLIYWFLEWEKLTGKRQTWVKFTHYLGVPYTTFMSWKNANIPPSKEYIDLLAKFRPDIYSILGLEADQATLVDNKIHRLADSLSPEDQGKFLSDVNKVVDEWLNKHAKRIK